VKVVSDIDKIYCFTCGKFLNVFGLNPKIPWLVTRCGLISEPTPTFVGTFSFFETTQPSFKIWAE
jgi:hypothetical protein